jgi:phage N-6-adenine-methyltransferase
MLNQEPLFPIPQQSRTSDDYYTPKWLFDALGIEFDIDVASPPEGPWHTPCERFYTQADDGLSQPWHGTVWMNPPYSNPKPWVAKWLEHENGCALVPFIKSKWFQTLWDDDRTEFAYIRVIKFERVEKTMNNQAPFALGLWAIGETCKHALRTSGLGKVR